MSKNGNHTPGPWTPSPEPGPYPVCIVEHENPDLSWFVNADGPVREDPEADARLIAAALELLAVCEEGMTKTSATNFPTILRELAEYLTGLGWGRTFPTWLCDRAAQIDAAVAKAKGETT